jgi:hypothetical protein
MIVERKKNENLDQIMYGEDFDDSIDGDDDDEDGDSKDSGEEVNSKNKKCLSRGLNHGKYRKMDHCTA